MGDEDNRGCARLSPHTVEWLLGVDLEVKEIALAIDTPDGIVLVVGCSHPTIEKIVEAAKSATTKSIHLVLGGTHLLPANDAQIRPLRLHCAIT